MYNSSEYAATQSHVGQPRFLPQAGGWILQRPLPHGAGQDASSPYPLFCCERWNRLDEDLRELRRDGLVSLTLVTEPFDALAPEAFAGFQVRRAFKEHVVSNLSKPAEQQVATRFRRTALRALKNLTVEVHWQPATHLDTWMRLYAELVRRHQIGPRRLVPRESMRRLFEMRDVVLMLALRQGEPVGGTVAVAQGDTLYSHLAAFTPDGYRCGASYALDWEAMHAMRGHADWIDWGGGSSHSPGLWSYKAGLGQYRRTTWLLGAVLDPAAYARACAGVRAVDGYFPAYRAGEFDRAPDAGNEASAPLSGPSSRT